LTEISLPATNHLHRRIAATEIQKNTADSMTLVTSVCPYNRRRQADESRDQPDYSAGETDPVRLSGPTACAQR